MNTAADDSLTFAGFELALDSGRLLHNGVHVKLRPKSSAVLAYLGRHANNLVSKRELMQAVWGDAEVGEGALTQSIIDIRKGLGAHRDLLRTVPRRGYVLETLAVQKPEPPAKRYWLARLSAAMAVAVVLLALLALGSNLSKTESERPLTLLVVPFSDVSPDQSLAHLGAGVAQEVGNLLETHLNIRVVRPPAARFDNDHVDQLVDAARASHLLRGSVSGSRNQSQVSVNLVDVESGIQLWSKRFEVGISDWLDLQRRISIAIAASLNTELALNDWRSVSNFQAWEHHQRGRFFYQRRAEGDLEQARQAFTQAIEKNAEYADAWLGLLAVEAFDGDGLTDQRVTRAMQRVQALAPERAETHMRIASIQLSAGLEALAMSHFARAIELEPDHAHVLSWMAGRAYAAGDYDAGRHFMLRAARSDPLNPVVQVNHFAALLGELRFDEARSQLDHIRLLEPYSPVSASLLEARLKLASGTFTLADEKRLELTPMLGRREVLILARAARGDRSPMSHVLEGEMMNGAGNLTSDLLIKAETQALLGDSELAKQTIRTMVDASAPEHRFFFLSQANLSPFLAHLRKDPDWPAADIRLPDGYAFNSQGLLNAAE
ncbi:MAG: winged helix-turn-helix domain-containing protein [Lysobacterales bacterium]